MSHLIPIFSQLTRHYADLTTVIVQTLHTCLPVDNEVGIQSLRLTSLIVVSLSDTSLSILFASFRNALAISALLLILALRASSVGARVLPTGQGPLNAFLSQLS